MKTLINVLLWPLRWLLALCLLATLPLIHSGGKTFFDLQAFLMNDASLIQGCSTLTA